jgi:hypothetical protein
MTETGPFARYGYEDWAQERLPFPGFLDNRIEEALSLSSDSYGLYFSSDWENFS